MVMVEIAKEIEQAVHECLEDKVGIAFSGGLDSATIAKVAKEYSEVVLFCVGVEGSEDLASAEEVAKELGLPLKKRVLTREDVVEYYNKAMGVLNSDFLKVEIMAPVYTVCEMAREERVDVVLQEKPHTLVFDMERLDYISSMGVRVIARAQKLMKAYDGKVALLNLQPQIQKVFDIIKALPSHQVFSNMEELDDYLDRMQRQVTG